LRHEEKLLKKKKKRRSRFGRFVLVLILVIVFLILAFYFLNNPSAFASIKNKLASFYTSQSTDKSVSTGSQDNSTESVSKTSADSSESSTPQASVDESGTSQKQDTNGAAITFWQKIIAFFKQKMSSQADNFPGTLNIKIYFASLGQDEVFVFEERLIDAGSPQLAVENAVNELLKGPSKSFYYPVIPPGTKLLDVQIYENLAKINFSQEFLQNSLESGILDDYVIYTIVDTVTQVPGVEGVIFLIDGKRIKLYGGVDISIPAIKNEKYLPVESSQDSGT